MMPAVNKSYLSVFKNRTTLVILAAALTLSAAMGIRQTFGLFIGPFSFDRGVPVTVIAFAIALHNLVWGLAQPFAGAAADRYGSAPVVGFGAVVFAAGLACAAVAPSGIMLVVGIGLLVGIGISCTSFGVVLTAVGRIASPETRSMAMGLASAGGSLGQVLLVPLAQAVTAASGISTSLLLLALVMLMAAPLGIVIDRRDTGALPPQKPRMSPLGEVLSRACRHRGYRLLTAGFFACGFQLAFIATHLPGYLALCHMPIGLGATALALIGLFNMAGSWACGWLGGRFRQQQVLGWLYLIRSSAIGAFFFLPKTHASVVIFAAVMGLT
jgi:MFS family permease